MSAEPTTLTLKHADYPHFPGHLYDCYLCESRCYCGKKATMHDNPYDVMCVHCALVFNGEESCNYLSCAMVHHA